MKINHHSHQMNCILFLDFDGVTHPDSCRKESFFCQLPLIENVLREYQHVDIVISSSWRYELRLPELQAYFSPDIRSRIIDVTPSLVRADADGWIPAHVLPHHRERECRKWMLEHQPLNAPWLAIDDVSDWFLPDCEHLLSTRSEFGFQAEQASILREMLNARTRGVLRSTEPVMFGSFYQTRCIGSLLGTAVGDILGANVEFFSRSEILQEHGRLVDFLDSPARPMGMFTDDTEMTVALAASLVSCGALDGRHCATAYAKAFVAEPRRGYGPSVSQILNMLVEGADFRTTGRAIHPQGSYANGGAMRIAPVGLAFRNASEDVLYRAVEMALLCTHVHPEAVDGAFIQAKTISELCRWNAASDARVIELLVHLQSIACTDPMRLRMGLILEGMARGWSDEKFLDMVCTLNEFGEQFQIHAAEAVACALWAFANEWSRPEVCVIRAVMLGGDADTVGAMTGAMVGALHGVDWIPNRWRQPMENGPGIGRDYLMDVGCQLGALDLQSLASIG